MSEGQLEFHLKLAVDPADHELIDFLRYLAKGQMTTRIEGDGDSLITVEVLEVSTTDKQDESNGRILADYFGIDDDREDGGKTK